VAQTCAVRMSADKIASREPVGRQESGLLQTRVLSSHLNSNQLRGLPASLRLTGLPCRQSSLPPAWFRIKHRSRANVATRLARSFRRESSLTFDSPSNSARCILWDVASGLRRLGTRWRIEQVIHRRHAHCACLRHPSENHFSRSIAGKLFSRARRPRLGFPFILPFAQINSQLFERRTGLGRLVGLLGKSECAEASGYDQSWVSRI